MPKDILFNVTLNQQNAVLIINGLNMVKDQAQAIIMGLDQEFVKAAQAAQVTKEIGNDNQGQRQAEGRVYEGEQEASLEKHEGE